MIIRRTKVEVGNIYNGIEILEFSHTDKNGKRRFKAKCPYCNNEFITLGTSIVNGRTKSCGCLNKKLAGDRARKHGYSGTHIYNVWKGMKSRCRDKSYHAYHRYSGRKIKVCKEWDNDFIAFYNDMAPTYFEGAELDRVDNDADYKPSNCRWVTHKENSNNRGKYKNNSGYTGVFFSKKNQTYQVNLSHNRKVIYIGSYKTLEKAVNARKEFIIEFNNKHNTNYKYEDYQV